MDLIQPSQSQTPPLRTPVLLPEALRTESLRPLGAGTSEPAVFADAPQLDIPALQDFLRTEKLEALNNPELLPELLPELQPELHPELHPELLKNPELLKIGDLARLTQKTVRALHFYEELEILRPVERTKGGFRLYATDAVSRVWLIDKLQILGLSLPEIRDLLRDWEESETGSKAARKVLEVMLARRRQLVQELERLQGLARELDSTVDYLHHCVTGCYKATAPEQCTACDHAADEGHRPKMISGLYPF